VTDRERLLEELRPTAFAIAYRMLGTVSEAEDVVQEALLRVHQAHDSGEQIASPHAFIATVTTRLAINELRSARARRVSYVGEWLPEPVITHSGDDPAHHAEMADSLSVAMLVLLESSRLSNEPCCCFTTCSTMAIRRSQRWSARARGKCACWPPARENMSSRSGGVVAPR
jgi:DNA-directed RNA polymerase specialized sigma24 family protein